MCVIIDKPENVEIPSALVREAVRANPDGWGVMRSDGKKLRTARGFGADGLGREIERIGSGACVVHARLATHGRTNKKNCHPFTILGGSVGLVHNGIISSIKIRRKEYSDTWHFARDIVERDLRNDPGLFSCPRWQEEMERRISWGNKIIMLRDDGAQTSLNRDEGVEWEGLWLSNPYSIPGWTRTTTRGRFRDLVEIDNPLAFDPYDKFTQECDIGTDYDDWTVDDLRALDDETLHELCLDDPDFIVDVIRRSGWGQ